MTNSRLATTEYVTRPSPGTRTPGTVKLALAISESQRKEIAARIVILRERSPYGQKTIADKLGIGLRGYQKVEKKGTGDFDRCRELAKIHRAWTRKDPEWDYVDADWIWSGRRPKTPDLGSTLREVEDDSKAALDQLVKAVAEIQESIKLLAQREARQAESLAALRQELRAATERATPPETGSLDSGD